MPGLISEVAVWLAVSDDKLESGKPSSGTHYWCLLAVWNSNPRTLVGETGIRGRTVPNGLILITRIERYD